MTAFFLEIDNYDTIINAFAAIPAGVTSLHFSGNDLDNKTGAELAQAFAAIPAGVTSLNLRCNSLDNKTGSKELAQEVHHLLPQKDADSQNYIGHVPKNHVANLMALCTRCHDEVHGH